MNELGNLLRKLRGEKSLRSIAEKTGLSHSYISDVESGYRRGTKKPLNPSPETLKRLASAYDYPYEKLMEIAGYINSDVSNTSSLPELSAKDKKDIAKDLEKIIQSLESKDGYSHFDGQTIDDLDEEDRELLIASLETSMKLAKQIAKRKFTPKKYRENK
ncbi:helix-turn-helix domain-containing protein [Bacillus sp. B-jedd]|uniref:helix-turn-helix domain-containing protein n=1 Tax=Bacillus sp. B-jedd TaxID=1476857 RepID=UPI0005155B40|nr:helix-turn-helix transcriptional regulator [Bacillus sp. B-jedd]CEG25966.1 immunity repressor protein (phage-like protein) [Bacillus sp. B-jedd]